MIKSAAQADMENVPLVITDADYDLMAADIGRKVVMEVVENDQTPQTETDWQKYQAERAIMMLSQVENISLSKINTKIRNKATMTSAVQPFLGAHSSSLNKM